MAYEIKQAYVKCKMTYITGICLRKSRGRKWCWLYGVYGVYDIDFNRTCVKVFRFISKFRVSRLTFIESQPRNTELGGL